MDSVITLKRNGKQEIVRVISGRITKETIRDAFFLKSDVSVALYKDGIMQPVENSVYNLGTDCNGQIYQVKWDEERRSRPPSRMQEGSPVPTTDLNEKQKEYIERLRKFMFYSILAKTETGTFANIGTIRNCVTVAEKDTALMAAHCLPEGVKEGFQFEIYSQENQSHLVQVKYINRKYDFVVLKTVDKEFDAYPIALACPDVGIEYAILGYHGYNYQPSELLSAFFGRIRNNKHCKYLSFVLGSPGTTRGCSGAGVFNLSCLVGIVVGGRVPPQNDYSKCGSLADIAEALVEVGEPSYSHIVPSSTIFALFNGYIDLFEP